jgi:hypothetical protein
MKTFHAAVRFDIEQKTNPDGSYALPISYVEVQTILTRWETDKNKAWKKALQFARDAKAPRRGYPRFAIAQQQAESREAAESGWIRSQAVVDEKAA